MACKDEWFNYTNSRNGSPAGYFAMSLCEPRQDRKVATVATDDVCRSPASGATTRFLFDDAVCRHIIHNLKKPLALTAAAFLLLGPQCY